MTNPNNNPTPPVSLDSLAVGRSSTNPFLTVFSQVNPTTNDVNYPIQTRWFNQMAETEYILTAFSVIGEVKTAIWQPINASQVAATETLTGNTGGPVGVDLNNNINVVGDATTINIVGNPGTHTLTASTSGSIATLYTENTGTAAPSGGNLNVLGTNGITTSGSGSTITISSTNGQIMTGIIPDAHTAPGTTPVVPNSSGNITVTGGQVAAGTTTNVIRTNSLAANTYTVQIQRSQAVASSTVGDNGVSHFNSSIFNVDGNGFVDLSTSFFTTGSFTPVLMFSGSSTGITYAAQNGKYTIVGNLLFYQTSLVLTSKGSAVGIAQIGG
ncbi:MAG TPA: hypothetical protein VNZ86_10380, partial [Bacteroidia bacterium]|nr:hypothetical protein [Bacteroidia bacterium]